MHEEPLHLVPPELREDIKKEYGIYIEGDLCPACQQMVRDKYGGKVEDVIVQRISFSEKTRIGIGTFTPSDPKSQDISELTGSVKKVTGLRTTSGCSQTGRPARRSLAG
jgi:serine protein kinase